MDKKARIEIDPAGGLLTVDGTLYLGETVDIEFVGVSSTPRLVLFDEDGVTALADNSTNPLVLDLRGSALRVRFAGRRCAIAFRAMAFGGDDDVYANGMVSVKWSPVVYDEAHEPATLRGPDGAKGDRGDVGPMGPLTQVKDPDTGKWYNVYARLDTDGNRVLSMDQTDSDPLAGSPVASKDEMTSAKERLDEVEELADDLDDRADDLEGRAEALEGRATSLESRATSLESRATAVEGRATAVEGRATAVEGGLEALDGKAVKVSTDAISGEKSIALDDVDKVTGSVFGSASMPHRVLLPSLSIKSYGTGNAICFGTYGEDGWEKAPCNGWLMLAVRANGSNQYVVLSVYNENDERVFFELDTPPTSSTNAMATVPVKKGFRVMVSNTLGGEISTLSFSVTEADWESIDGGEE